MITIQKQNKTDKTAEFVSLKKNNKYSDLQNPPQFEKKEFVKN